MSFTERMLSRKYVLWLIPVIFFMVLIGVNWIQLFTLNDGHFVYMLDDAYIHLALAENIAQGHYGVNLHEYSAPSSSILWPFLLAPLAQTAAGEYVPFAISLICSISIIIVFCLSVYSISLWILKGEMPELYQVSIVLFGCLLPVTANLIGMTFIGMEHTLQTLCSLLIIVAFFKELQNNEFPWWGVAAIVLAPFIRYEAGALSAGAIVALYYRGHFKKATISLCVIGVGILSFSFFLQSLGLEFLPTSVLAKSHIRRTLPLPIAILVSIAANLYKRFGILLVVGSALLFYKKSEWNKYKHIAFALAGAIVAHIVFGDVRDRRYVLYLIVPLFLMVLASYAKVIAVFLTRSRLFQENPLLKLHGIALAVFVVLYIGEPSTTPYASNNIYEQQFQMKRFVEIYNKPVGINDLGLVSYRNNNYVLDLWGLASLKALRLRQNEVTPEWMDVLSRQKNVKTVMIYNTWFPEIPQNWVKVAHMGLSRKNVILGGDTVSFYVTDKSEIAPVRRSLASFKKILPSNIPLVILPNEN